jgi:thiamine-phosphate pyrophosphorylase
VSDARSAPPTSPARDGAWRRRRLADSRLYLCTPRRDDLAAFVDAVLAAGVDMIQLRDKHAGRDAQAEASEMIRRAAHDHGALFVLNDDPALAAEVDADGVHVGQEDAPVADARAAVGPDRLVGRSTHSRAQALEALATDADYLSIGPVHATPTKEGRPPIGLAPVREVAAVADRPWFVTGVMADDTIPETAEADARRFVVVRAITEAADPGAAVRRLREVLDAAVG